eukprot:COSAG01_NODE_9034_length_2575_cov_3.615105_1_plen_112_part_10
MCVCMYALPRCYQLVTPACHTKFSPRSSEIARDFQRRLKYFLGALRAQILQCVRLRRLAERALHGCTGDDRQITSRRPRAGCDFHVAIANKKTTPYDTTPLGVLRYNTTPSV